MKTITFLVFSLLVVNYAFTQSKKDMEQKILLIEEKQKNLENEISNIKTNLLNTTTTLGLVSKSNIDLEKLVEDQNQKIGKLIKQNDSLLILFKVKQEADFITTPKNEEDSIVSALPTPSFTIAEPGLPLRQKSGYHENIEVGGNVCQGR